MTMVTIKPVDAIDDLFCKYPGQNKAQPVELSLDTRSGVLSCDYDPAIGGGSTFAHYYRLILAAVIPCLTAEAANAFMAEVVPLAQRVVDGAEEVWDGDHYVGRFTPDAMTAWEQITELCAPENFHDRDTVSWLDVNDWFSEGDDDTRESLGITADTTDQQLADTAVAEVAAAATNGTAGYNVLDDDDTLKYLTGLRDEQRDAVRERLSDVAERISNLEDERNKIVRQVKSWGIRADTNRTLGALAGVSHTQIGRILGDSNTEADGGGGPATRTPAQVVADALAEAKALGLTHDYTIQVQEQDLSSGEWIALRTRYDYTSTGTPRDAAGDILATSAYVVGDIDQNDNWRVVVWASHIRDLSQEPVLVYDAAALRFDIDADDHSQQY